MRASSPWGARDAAARSLSSYSQCIGGEAVTILIGRTSPGIRGWSVWRAGGQVDEALAGQQFDRAVAGLAVAVFADQQLGSPGRSESSW
jgi:hypothetical protein